MGMVILSVICSFAAYVIGAVIENTPGVNLPGFGVALAVITMGAFILSKSRKK